MRRRLFSLATTAGIDGKSGVVFGFHADDCVSDVFAWCVRVELL